MVKEHGKKGRLYRSIHRHCLKKGFYPVETSIHTTKVTAIKVALGEIHGRRDRSWVVYEDYQSTVKSVVYSRESHSILALI